MPGSTTLPPSVRRIRSDEGVRLRALRLRALTDAPLAFGSTLAREEAFPPEVWDERATRGAAGEDQVTCVAEDGDRWTGMAVDFVGGPDPSRLALVGLFVEPAARGRGVGGTLVEAVVEWARGRGAAGLSLWVVSTNRPAIALYERCAFRPTGQRQPLDHTPTLTELQMIRDL
jgi:GNAT superfamily N-acetyltransferase